jgi:hypothetical protein
MAELASESCKKLAWLLCPHSHYIDLSEIPLSSDGIVYFARAVGRRRAIHMENSGFASPTLGQYISTFRGYRILFSIRNPYINRFINHFSIHS